MIENESVLFEMPGLIINSDHLRITTQGQQSVIFRSKLVGFHWLATSKPLYLWIALVFLVAGIVGPLYNHGRADSPMTTVGVVLATINCLLYWRSKETVVQFWAGGMCVPFT